MKKTSSLAALAIALALPTMAQANWSQIEKEAKGQTVYFNAWGGGDAINAYVAWAAKEAKSRFGVDVKHVKVTDTGDVVKRIQTEVEAGRKTDGSVDLLWVNGENFRKLKQGNFLFGPWAESLPNWRFVDLKKPVQYDFSVPTEGFEAPWGTAQLTFIADRAKTPSPPRSSAELLSFAKANPGRVTYPKPGDFHGTTFVKQMLLEVTPDRAAFQKPYSADSFAKLTPPLWAYLDQLHPSLWRSGKAFPASAAEMNRMLADGELKVSLTFNPNEAANLIVAKQLPTTAYSFGLSGGTIGNVHFLAIATNAKAKAGAQVFANFLLSPEAQAKKADITQWGDPTVLDITKLPAPVQASLRKTVPGALQEDVATLAEPHASWVAPLEAEWLKRYSAR
jgi:putative thiamine transport system substrate-binding protein